MTRDHHPLPSDIWFHVADHIPRSELPALISVNQPLFHAGLNALFERTELNFELKNDITVNRLLHNRENAERIRVLHIGRPSRFRFDEFTRANFSGSRPSTDDNSTLHFLVQITNIRSLLPIVPLHFWNIVDLTLDLGQITIEKRSVPVSFFCAVMKATGQNLRRLSLRGTLPVLAQVLPPEDIKRFTLNEIDLCLYKSNQNMQTIPGSTILESATSTQSFATSISLFSPSLAKFSLRTQDKIDISDFLLPSFTHLSSLTLTLTSPQNINAAIECIRCTASMLTTLCLSGEALSLGQIRNLVRALCGSPIPEPDRTRRGSVAAPDLATKLGRDYESVNLTLRYLNLVAHTLSLHLIDLFGTYLRGLDTLVLPFFYLLRTDIYVPGVKTDPIDIFEKSLKAQPYANTWGLKDINITHLTQISASNSSLPQSDNRESGNRIMHAIARSISGVEYVRGNRI